MSGTDDDSASSLGLRRSAWELNDNSASSLGSRRSAWELNDMPQPPPLESEESEETEEYESSEEISDENLDEFMFLLETFIRDSKNGIITKENISDIKSARDDIESHWYKKFTEEKEWEKFFIEIYNSLILYNMMNYTKNPKKFTEIEASELYKRYENFIKKDKIFLRDVKENILPEYIEAYDKTHRPPQRYNLRKRPAEAEAEGEGKSKGMKKDGRSVKKGTKKSRIKKRSKNRIKKKSKKIIELKKSIKKRLIRSLRKKK